MKILILYGTTTGNTAYVAEIIASAIKGHNIDIKNVCSFDVEELQTYDFIIMGTPTWANGEIQKDWKNFLPKLNEQMLKNKIIALFGLGDSALFPDQFASGIRELYDKIITCKAEIIGFCDIEGYKFNDSKAVVDGKFCGLIIDQDNESNMTVDRVYNWTKNLFTEIDKREERD
ncbi:MAG TPA: flavodoxin [Candidatus Hydrogenedens sp.]|nr:flavodoxin [Candidatus Hydrogenedens sp.]HOK08601.1 flavodoxin [Candidatus Hydrogenedens sp.]HPP58358.1 flavodoxin [Candidatus Hydrogenedens sp.]